MKNLKRPRFSKPTAEQNAKLIKSIQKDSDIKTQVDAYKGQVERLKKRSNQVDEILKIYRTNPKRF